MMIADGPSDGIKAIMGLGNPGRRYAETRHNYGFMVVDRIAFLKRKEFSRGDGPYFACEVEFGGENLTLVKSTTYMNNSGKAAALICESFAIVPSQLLVIADDCNLPLGKIRYRPRGSDGGHNGLLSIIEHLQTEEFPRIRLGIGETPNGKPREDFVLEEFALEETKTVEKVITKTIELIETLVANKSRTSSITVNAI
ncbi:MAG: aminoacyl-tRNA hydrolase [candidate division Zixibacteria bacterium]|nr:aminoacyl-tRNA hydrolase [candidate division Zixibacteria bacterium]